MFGFGAGREELGVGDVKEFLLREVRWKPTFLGDAARPNDFAPPIAFFFFNADNDGDVKHKLFTKIRAHNGWRSGSPASGSEHRRNIGGNFR